MTIYTNTLSDLEKLGLSPNEALVYQACLTNGESTIINLAKQTGISRTTIYGVADDLVHKGVLRFIQKQAHRIYSAEDPRKIGLLFERQKAEIDQRGSYLESILPVLSMQYAAGGTKPLVSYYQGQEEVRQIFEDVIVSKPKEVLFVCESGTLQQAVGEVWLKQYVKRRVMAGIHTRGVFAPTNAVNDPLFDSGGKHKRDVRLGPHYLKAPVYTGIYLNKVYFISSLQESYGVLIESRDLAETMRGWHQALWDQSTEV